MLAGCTPEPGPGGDRTGPDPAPATRAQEPPRTQGERLRDELLAAQAAIVHPSDGGGSAWLELAEGEDGSVQAGRAGRWTIVYEAGELGIAEGGAIHLQVSPFWNWSTPQAERSEAPGFTEVETEAEGVELDAFTADQQLLVVGVGGRGLTAGERVRIRYGAGPSGARADSYAERESRFWIGVDGDGDGVRKLIAASPAVTVRPGPPARLVLNLTSTARPGEAVRLTAAVLDPVGNAGPDYEGSIVFEPLSGLELPKRIELGPGDGARATVELAVRELGVFRARGRAELPTGPVEVESNPLLVTEGGPRIRWADLHGHSAVSDGTGTPEDYFLYARDVAGLDAVALTDHDHWGLLFMDEHPELWETNKAVGNRFDEPGRFVTLHGFEWTNWVYGHRHVLYFSNEAPLLSSLDPATDTPQELWEALRGLDALTVPHHPAGGPVAIDWDVPPDPVLEPSAEVTSAHGCSEARDCRLTIYSAVEGAFVRDAIDRGYHLGFIGSGDGHDGHPGLTHLDPVYPTGGLAAVLSDELNRPALLEALRARRAYATSGHRIVLRTALGAARMGQAVRAAELGPEATLFVQAHGTAPILGVEVVRSGEVVAGLAGDGSPDFLTAATLSELAAGEYVYVRVVQEDGGQAWSSPIRLE